MLSVALKPQAPGLEDAGRGGLSARRLGAAVGPPRRSAAKAAAAGAGGAPSLAGPGSDLDHLHAFLDAAPSGTHAASVAQLGQLHDPATAVLGAGRGAWEGSVRTRRHLRRRVVAMELPPGWETEEQTSAATQQQAAQQPVAEAPASLAAAAAEEQQQQQEEQQAVPADAAVQATAAPPQQDPQQEAAAPAASQVVQASAPPREQYTAQGAAAGAAAVGRQQLSALQELSSQQLANLAQAASVVRQQAAHTAHVVAQAAARQLGSVQQSASTLQGRVRSATTAKLAQQQRQRQAAARKATAAPAMQRRVAAAAATTAPSPTIQLAPVHSSLGQWAAAAGVAAMAAAAALLRARRQRARARSAPETILQAEQRARAARVYSRQRQRFQRALVAAEDLEAPPEGADSSVFTAVRRKGANAAPTAAGAAAASGEASAAAILGGDVVGFAGTGVPGGTGGSSAPELAAVGAAALASTDVDDSYLEESLDDDVFNPASWDADTRREWDAFVSSSKVNKGKLWDSTQVDEGLPQVWLDLNQ